MFYKSWSYFYIFMIGRKNFLNWNSWPLNLFKLNSNDSITNLQEIFKTWTSIVFAINNSLKKLIKNDQSEVLSEGNSTPFTKYKRYPTWWIWQLINCKGIYLGGHICFLLISNMLKRGTKITIKWIEMMKYIKNENG